MKGLNLVVFAGVCLTAAVWLLVISGGIYGIGWWYFRPLFEIRSMVDFDFGSHTQHKPVYWTQPIGLPQLPLDDHDYSVSLELKVPRSPHNLEIDNFMVTLELAKDGAVVQTLKRMNLIPYKNSIVETMDSVVFSPIYLFRWSDQVELLKVHLDDLAMPLRNFDSFRLALGHNVQIAGAELVWTTQLKGLRRLMYNSPLSTCFVFVGTLWFSGVLVTITVALLVGFKMQRGPEENGRKLAPSARPELVSSRASPGETPMGTPRGAPRAAPRRATRPVSRKGATPAKTRFLKPRRFRAVDVSASDIDWDSDTNEDTVDTTHESK